MKPVRFGAERIYLDIYNVWIFNELLPSPSSAKDLLAHLPWRAMPGERRRGRRLELGV
jgi:hypothetical protein